MPTDEHDLDALDASWEEPKTPTPPTPTPTPTPDLDTLDEGWDAAEARRHKTGAERALARKAKALARADRQRAKSTAAAQRQKQKQKPKRAEPGESETEGAEPALAKPAPRAKTAEIERVAARNSWIRMLVAVALIVAIAAFVLFVVVR